MLNLAPESQMPRELANNPLIAAKPEVDPLSRLPLQGAEESNGGRSVI